MACSIDAVSHAGNNSAGVVVKSAKSAVSESTSAGLGQTTTSASGASASSAAAASAQLDPQIPPNVAPWPNFRLAITSAKPGSSYSDPASSSSRPEMSISMFEAAMLHGKGM